MRNIPSLTPVLKIDRRKLWAVVGSDGHWLPTEVNNLVQTPDYALRRKRCIYLYGQDFPGAVVDHIERSKLSVADHTVAHEIHAPGGINGVLLP